MFTGSTEEQLDGWHSLHLRAQTAASLCPWGVWSWYPDKFQRIFCSGNCRGEDRWGHEDIRKYIYIPKTVSRHELRSKHGWSAKRICLRRKCTVFYIILKYNHAILVINLSKIQLQRWIIIFKHYICLHVSYQFDLQIIDCIDLNTRLKAVQLPYWLLLNVVIKNGHILWFL